MPDISYQKTQAEALIKTQIESSDNVAQTLPYWAVYQAITGSSGSAGSSIDVSILAKETTLGAVNTKLPNLSSGKIPVTIGSINLTADWRLLTETTVIPAGSCYVYLFVKQGDVTINGLTKTTGEYINLEPSPFARHPEINIVIPAGKSIELIRGY